MKSLRHFSFLLLCSFIFWSCSKDSEKPAFAFTTDTIADSTAIEPNKSITLKTTQNAIWALDKKDLGAIDANGTYTPTLPATKSAGVIIITAKNASDTTKKVTRRLYITPRATLLNDMQKGGYVLSFRHGNASTGQDQLGLAFSTNWWKSCDASLARQLDTKEPSGFTQMQATGRALRNLKLVVGKVMSSEYCRCLQSAQELRFTNLTIEQNKDITYYVYDEANRYQNTMKLINSQPINAKNVVIVTHAGFSMTPNPAPLNVLNWGDAAIFKLQANQTANYVSSISSREWVDMQ
jgi:phosphohistidine phosphatase SixA